MLAAAVLTEAQEARVTELRAALVRLIIDVGLKLEHHDVPEAAFYDRGKKRIVLSTRNRARSPLVVDRLLPPSLRDLFTLSHELGHHLSQNGHVVVGRHINEDIAADVLYEESSAWQEAVIALERCGLEHREHVIWEAFQLMMSESLMTYSLEFSVVHEVQEHVTRKRIKCPTCRSSFVIVIGLRTRKNLALACRDCHTHSRPHRTPDAVVRSLRPRSHTFANLCNCADEPAPDEDES